MKDDRFYADYRKSALLVSGTVASVRRRGGHLIVGFKTDSSYRASRDLGTATVAARSCIAGMACEQMSRGIVAVACSRRADSPREGAGRPTDVPPLGREGREVSSGLRLASSDLAWRVAHRERGD